MTVARRRPRTTNELVGRSGHANSGKARRLRAKLSIEHRSRATGCSTGFAWHGCQRERRGISRLLTPLAIQLPTGTGDRRSHDCRKAIRNGKTL